MDSSCARVTSAMAMVVFVVCMVFGFTNFFACNQLAQVVHVTSASSSDPVVKKVTYKVKLEVHECNVKLPDDSFFGPIYYQYGSPDRCCMKKDGSFRTAIILFMVDGIIIAGSLLLICCRCCVMSMIPLQERRVLPDLQHTNIRPLRVINPLPVVSQLPAFTEPDMKRTVSIAGKPGMVQLGVVNDRKDVVIIVNPGLE